MGYSHLFGPVASRRLGRSLGVDLVPYKVCSFDCIYCEVGRTTLKTTARQEFFPPEDARSMVIETIRRRPSTLDDLAAQTGLHRQEVIKMLRALSSDPHLITRREARGTFYCWSGD